MGDEEVGQFGSSSHRTQVPGSGIGVDDPRRHGSKREVGLLSRRKRFDPLPYRSLESPLSGPEASCLTIHPSLGTGVGTGRGGLPRDGPGPLSRVHVCSRRDEEEVRR